MWTLADLVIAWAVARLAERRRRSVVLEEDGERRWSGAKIAAMSVDPKNLSLFEASKLNMTFVAATSFTPSRSRPPSPGRAPSSRTSFSHSPSSRP